MDNLIWQMHADNEWRFGQMLRGVVRCPYLAEIYFDEERNPGWIWLTNRADGHRIRGCANCFDDAVIAAENVLREQGVFKGG